MRRRIHGRTFRQVRRLRRCKTPAMVRMDMGMHLPGCNLSRTLLAQAARAADVSPREWSCMRALRTLHAIAPLWSSGDADHAALYARLLRAIARHRLGDRPDRIEPRAVRRRPRPHTFLSQFRHVARTCLQTKE